MTIYCDTNTLFSNIKEPAELAALARLLADHRAGKLVMYRSLVDLREVMDTKDAIQQGKLLAEYEELQPIPKDERVYGFSSESDPYGGHTSNSLVSDVQDEDICGELEQRGPQRRDAQHITQAICNRCDIFLTRDRKTIIDPHRTWIEARFPELKVPLPSEV